MSNYVWGYLETLCDHYHMIMIIDNQVNYSTEHSSTQYVS